MTGSSARKNWTGWRKSSRNSSSWDYCGKCQSYDNVLEVDATLKGNKTIEGDLTIKGRLKDKDGNDFNVASIPDDVIITLFNENK